ncbi:MAG: hypothetical protein Q4C97_00430 [Bacillota bacterium]|nr:hypothetical protein [Bacillota bacterium]
MKWRMKKITALLLSSVMTVSVLVGCGGGSGEKNDTAKESKTEGKTEEGKESEAGGETEITFWCKDALETGAQHTAIADEIAKKTGVRLNVVNGDAQKFKVLLAGGDLPGIVNSNYGDLGVDANALLESGQLIPLDELIEEHAPNLKEKFADAIEYSKEFLSNDGQLYYLPIQINHAGDTKVVDRSGANLALYTRYDLYKEIGSPEIKTIDDYLNALKAMQDLEPETEDGKKTYAISGFSDWGLWMWTIPYQAMSGVTNWSYGMCYDMVNKKPMATYYSEPFWDCMEFYNKAYNMGILDPEIFTQKYDNYMDKLKNGQTFVTYANWLYNTANDTYAAAGHPEKGFQIIPTGLDYMYNAYEGEKPFGWAQDYPLALTKNCEDPVKAIKMIDYLFSEEGARLLNSGVEGVHWEVVDGVPQMTQTYRDNVAENATYAQSEGFAYTKLSGLSSSQILSDGYPASLLKAPEEIEKATTKIDDIFIADSETPDAKYPGQVIEAKIESGEYKLETGVDLTTNLIKEPSDETKNLSAQVDEYVKVGVADVIMASEDEFEAKKESFIEAIEGKGYAEVVKEMEGIWAEAQKTAKDFAKK